MKEVILAVIEVFNIEDVVQEQETEKLHATNARKVDFARFCAR